MFEIEIRLYTHYLYFQNAKYICTGCIDDESLYHHYALNVPLYTHFTSPIRRYPDVIVHRLLGATLGKYINCFGHKLLWAHGGHMSERFFRSSRPGYPHPVSSELENSGIRVAVGDCSVTERRRWRLTYQTGKTVHVHANYYKHNEDGRTAQGVCGSGSILQSHSGNVVTRIGIHTLLWASMA